jgi:hypothetical protein
MNYDGVLGVFDKSLVRIVKFRDNSLIQGCSSSVALCTWRTRLMGPRVRPVRTKNRAREFITRTPTK